MRLHLFFAFFLLSACGLFHGFSGETLNLQSTLETSLHVGTELAGA